MDPTRKVLLTDGAVGLATLAVGARLLDAPFRWWVLLLAGGTALGVAGMLFGAEQQVFASTGLGLATAGVFVLVPLGVSLAFMQVSPSLGSALALSAVLGTGGGLLGYRFVFGVLRPVPQHRLDRADERAV